LLRNFGAKVKLELYDRLNLTSMINFYLYTWTGRILGTLIILYLVFEYFRLILKAYIKWEPRDVWIGLYYDQIHAKVDYTERCITWRCYLCIIPCFPIIWDVTRAKKFINMPFEWNEQTVRDLNPDCYCTKQMREGALFRSYNGLRTGNPYVHGTKEWQDWDYGWFESNEAAEYFSKPQDDRI